MGAMTGLTALIVEDNPIIAEGAVCQLLDLDARDVRVSSTERHARVLLGEVAFSLVLLDMDLKGVMSFKLARSLKAMGVPFMFVTGYGPEVVVSDDLCDAIVLRKPVQTPDLEAAIKQILA